MILVLVAPDPARLAHVLGYLTARSIDHVDLTTAPSPSRALAALGDGHYVVTGVTVTAELAGVRDRADFRLVFVGPPPASDDPLLLLHDVAHARLDGPDEEVAEELRALTVAAMSHIARPGWDDYFMAIAEVVARRSNCLKRRIAALIVRDQRIVTTGYNGTPRGARNCNEGGCPRCSSLAPSGTVLEECLCNHAEENAIVQAAFHGISVRGGILYCTHSPCLHCTKLIINAGLVEVVYNAEYPLGERSLALLSECGVKVRRYGA